jgi:nicotinate-nucleotide pyrophosphorylase (carboxylating)
MLDKAQVKGLVDLALAEDLGRGDVTTNSLIPEKKTGVASILAQEKGILAGGEVARQVFHQVDPELKVRFRVKDGAALSPGEVIATVEGRAASILKAERTALNFLQRLSGIATETNRYVKAVEGLPVRILDTRKTAPGLRALEKYAVKVGGGKNHRMHLGDGVLIKDNHRAALQSEGLSIREIIARIWSNTPSATPVEIEVNTPQEALEAAEAGANIVMLDNMSLDDMRQAVKMLRGVALIEASGKITLDTVRAVAETGVDFISVGAITHSARALDISLELE